MHAQARIQELRTGATESVLTPEVPVQRKVDLLAALGAYEYREGRAAALSEACETARMAAYTPAEAVLRLEQQAHAAAHALEGAFHRLHRSVRACGYTAVEPVAAALSLRTQLASAPTTQSTEESGS